MSNIKHLERKYQLPADGDLTARLERIREAVANKIEQTDPDSADKLRCYGTTDLVCFLDYLVRADRRKIS